MKVVFSYNLDIMEEGGRLKPSQSKYKISSVSQLSQTGVAGHSVQTASVAINMRITACPAEGKLYVGLPVKENIEVPAEICGNFELDHGRNELVVAEKREQLEQETIRRSGC